MRKKVDATATTESIAEQEKEEEKTSITVPEDSPLNIKLGESLGFGFVSFTTIESAIRAKHECKTKLFKGRFLIVN
jgi:RNA recognition motif-containing protein